MASEGGLEIGASDELIQEVAPQWILPKTHEAEVEEAKTYEGGNATERTQEPNWKLDGHRSHWRPSGAQ